MPRIIPSNGINRIAGSSAQYRPDLADEDEIDMDTADRGMRDPSMRGPMHQTRESQSDARNTPRMSVPDIDWRSPMALDAPPPRPGFEQRWIRMTLKGGEHDVQNVNTKSRLGWTPRDPTTIPEGQLFSSISTQAGAHGGVIRVGNMVLHEIDKRLLKRQRQINMAKAQAQEEAVVRSDTDKASREGQRAGYDPIVREERTNVSTGRRPSTLAD
jgi:hypothetical protein